MSLPIQLPQDHVKFWLQNLHCKYVLDFNYVSNLTNEDLERFGDKLDFLGLGDHFSCISLGKVEERSITTQFWITTSFNDVFSCVSDPKQRTVRGWYLRIITAFKEMADEEEVTNRIVKAANILRLLYGYGAAFELAEKYLWDLKQDTISMRTEQILVKAGTGGDGKKSDFLYNSQKSGLLPTHEFTMNPEASFFFDKAASANEKRDHFLFLWLALEAQLGNGKKRAAFCKDELKSDKISEEMKRCHTLRSELLHPKVGGSDTELPSNELIEMLRIACLPKCEARDRLVELF